MPKTVYGLVGTVQVSKTFTSEVKAQETADRLTEILKEAIKKARIQGEVEVSVSGWVS